MGKECKQAINKENSHIVNIDLKESSTFSEVTETQIKTTKNKHHSDWQLKRSLIIPRISREVWKSNLLCSADGGERSKLIEHNSFEE